MQCASYHTKNNQTSFWSLLVHRNNIMTSQEYQTVGSSPSWLLLYRSVLIQWNTATFHLAIYNNLSVRTNSIKTTIFGTLKLKSNDTLFMPKIDTTNTLPQNITVVIMHPNENWLKRLLTCSTNVFTIEHNSYVMIYIKVFSLWMYFSIEAANPIQYG